MSIRCSTIFFIVFLLSLLQIKRYFSVQVIENVIFQPLGHKKVSMTLSPGACSLLFLWSLISLRLFLNVFDRGIVPSRSRSPVNLNTESWLHDLLVGRKTGFLGLVFVWEWLYESFWKGRLLDALVCALHVRQLVRNPTLQHHVPGTKGKVQRKASDAVLLSHFPIGPWR